MIDTFQYCIQNQFHMQMFIDTDVNGACYMVSCKQDFPLEPFDLRDDEGDAGER